MARRLIPFYVWPGFVETWRQAACLLSAGDAVVINPSSGVGSRRSATWARAVELVQMTGAAAVGYVPVHWGQRRAADCLRDAAAYVDWYGVDGIFWDEAPTASGLDTHDWLRAVHTAGPSGLAFWNAGTAPVPRAAVDATRGSVWCTFEGTATTYLEQRPVPANPEQEAHLIHTCPDALRRSVCAHISSCEIEWAHVTRDGATSRPWEQLWQ